MSSTAVVILNWNGKDFMKKFIPLILSRTDFSDGSALYVADNGSQDGSVEWIRETWPGGEVRLVCMDRNYGFTGGYNRAFAEIERSGAQFDYYLLLNSDIEVTDGWLGELEHFMDSHPRCGACAPKILSYDRRTMFEHAGACGGFVDRWYFPYCRGRILSKVEEDTGQYDAPCRVFWASGAALMVRSGLWRQSGGLDESFFAHMEEIDLCWRAQLAGWEIWAVPSSRVYHGRGRDFAQQFAPQAVPQFPQQPPDDVQESSGRCLRADCFLKNVHRRYHCLPVSADRETLILQSRSEGPR